jgi:hypothetical protein
MSNMNQNVKDISFHQLYVPNNNLKEENTIPFWCQNPNVIFQNNYLFEFFPVDSMTFSQKLNAISRSVIILSLIAYFFSRNFTFILVLAITLFAIHMYFTSIDNETKKNESKRLNGSEGFENAGLAIINDPSYNKGVQLKRDEVFDKVSSQNPFSNVLLPDLEYNTQKKPAPPAYASDINSQILSAAKQTVKELNPDQPDIADKLFKDLGEQLEFEQSMRNFYSNPNTTICNDQTAFAEFCYGGMVSCKEGNLFACARNLDRHSM